MSKDLLQVRSVSVSFSAGDLAASQRFYTDGLGFSVDEEMKGDDGTVQGLILKAGQANVGLSQDDFAKGRDRVKGVGMSLYLETDQDIHAVAQRARDAGLQLDGDPAPMPWGPLGFAVKDPDGFRVIVSNAS